MLSQRLIKAVHDGRSRISFDKWIDMDLEYINDQNLWRDFKIILKTIPAVFNADGAY